MSKTLPSDAPLAWLFCAIAVALGWGIRGEIGGPDGATVPGALLGLAIAATSGRPDWIRRAPVFGMAGALGFALGGSMSYGLLIGYTRGIDLQNVGYGFAMLGVVGGLWGAFGAGCLGIAASPVRYRVWQVLAFVAVALVSGEALHWLLVDLAGLRANPPRGDSWPQCLAAVLALLGFARIKRDALPARMAFWGLAAGSAGFMIGELFQVAGSSIGPDLEWWKIMEQTFGFILGAGIGWAMLRETRGMAEAPAPAYSVTVFGLIVSAWYVGVNAAEEITGYFAREEMGVLTRTGDIMDTVTQFRIREIVLAAMIAAIGFALRKRSGKLIAPDFAAKLLFSFVMWFCVMVSTFKKSVPAWDAKGLGVHTGFLIMAAILTLWLWFGWPVTGAKKPAPPGEPAPPLRYIAPIYIAIVFPLLAVLLAVASIATHPGEWVPDAHKRFGDEPTVAP